METTQSKQPKAGIPLSLETEGEKFQIDGRRVVLDSDSANFRLEGGESADLLLAEMNLKGVRKLKFRPFLSQLMGKPRVQPHT